MTAIIFKRMERDMFHWCFIGTGKLANIVARQLLKSQRHEIVSCYSRNQKTCEKFAKKYHACSCSSPLEAMMKEGVDAVYIVTPHNVHFKYAKLALENKKPVLVEKPFTVNQKEAEELISLSRKNDVFLSEAMWTFYHGASKTMISLMEEKKIGKIENVLFTYHLNSVHYAKRVADRKRAGGALLDIGVYPVYYAYRLFGMPEKIKAEALIENGIDLKDEIIFSYKEGYDVKISISIVDLKGLEKCIITSDTSTIRIPFYHHANSLKIKYKDRKKEVLRPKNEKKNISYLYEFDETMNQILLSKKENESTPLEDTLHVMSLLDEIRKEIGLVYDQLEQ